MCSDGKLFFFNAPSGTGTATLTKRLEIETDGTVTIPGNVIIGGENATPDDS